MLIFETSMLGSNVANFVQHRKASMRGPSSSSITRKCCLPCQFLNSPSLQAHNADISFNTHTWENVSHRGSSSVHHHILHSLSCMLRSRLVMTAMHCNLFWHSRKTPVASGRWCMTRHATDWNTEVYFYRRYLS